MHPDIVVFSERDSSLELYSPTIQIHGKNVTDSSEDEQQSSDEIQGI